MSFSSTKSYLKSSVIKTINLLPVTSVTLGSPRKVLKAANLNLRNGEEYITVINEKNIQETPPKTIDKKVFFKYHSYYNRVQPEQFILKLQNARVWGRNGAVITENDEFVSDLSVEFGSAKLDVSKHSVFHRIKLKKPTYFNGTLAVIASPGPNVYAHWYCDIIPRLVLLKNAGVLEKVDKILISYSKTDFQLDTLKRLEIPEEKLINCIDDPEFHIQAKTIYVPSQPNLHGTVNHWIDGEIKKIHDIKNKSIIGGPRLYISRSKAVGRRMVNEDELFEVLNEYGFEKIIAEDYTMQQKVELFNSAECIVAPHGGGVTNIIFCSSGCKVIDIFPPGDFTTYFWSLANGNNLDYYYFFGEGKMPTPENDFTSRNADIKIDIEKFKALLQLTKLEKRN